MGKFYISAPVDEVKLAETVAPTVSDFSGRLPTSEELKHLAQMHDLDFATMVLYQAIHASSTHASFINAVDHEPISTVHPPVGAKILIIPALFHGHYPETGADAKFAADIAHNCGFEVGTIPIRSVASCTANAQIIHETLRKEEAQHIWIFGVSKGSADFRAYLQRYPDSPAISKIKGWINVCGLPRGCQISDYNTATRLRQLKYRAICRIFGVRYELMRELRTDHPYWANQLAIPPHMKVFNFSAIPLGSHIQKALIGRYLAISHLGPNDGMVLCRDSILDQGPVYPVWGSDHFFRTPLVIPLLYKFFSYLRRQ
jgi:hypothetical protein